MRATNFEFKIRFWIIGAIFGIAFSFYRFDPINISDWLGSLMAGAPIDSPPTIRLMRIIFALAALWPIAGAVVRTWAGAYLHSSVIHDTTYHFEVLVADGPYRHVRNPLYLGVILSALGYGFMASRIGFLMLTIGMTIFVYRLILREEAGLLASQGESYAAYYRMVPRLIPSVKARVAASGSRPDWRDALLGETMMWGCAVAMVVFAATLERKPFYIILYSALGLYIIQNFVLHPKSKTPIG
jgi:protein-S-isoprenylcysteine O-methyltransferase Ste14